MRGDDAERRFRQAEVDRVRSDGHVGGARKSECAAHHSALKHCDDGEWRMRIGRAHMSEFGVGFGYRVAVVSDGRGARNRHVLEVRARREMAAASAQDDDTDTALLSLCERIQELDQHSLRHGIANLRPVQPDMQDAAFPLKQKRAGFGLGHGVHPSFRGAECLPACK